MPVLLLSCLALTFGACQHQRLRNTNETLKSGKGGNCEEPQFEMKYYLGEVMPAYIDLGVELHRAEGAFLANFGNGDKYDTEIRVDKREEGLMATISTRQAEGMEKQAEGLIVSRYGVEDPFMLVIENGSEDGNPLSISVKAREMSERKNRGILKNKKVTARMPAANPEYLQVSSHHRGLIVTEGGNVKEKFFMKNGIYRGKTITTRKFQDVAEAYLSCLGKSKLGKGKLEEGKGKLQEGKGGKGKASEENKYGK